MNKKNKVIPIFFAVDDNYIKFLKISLVSMMANASKSRRYDIYILHDGLSNESKNEIKKLKNRRFNFKFRDVGGQIRSLSNKFKVRDYYTLTTYYRLVIPDTFFWLDKALYLDSDIIVNDDISKLFDIDIGSNLVGAVRDQSLDAIPEFATYSEKALDIRHEKYFNAGVLLMNLKRMRNEHFTRQIVLLTKQAVYKVAQDQDVLNVVCKDKVHYIEETWNTMPIGEKKEENPSLIHYNLIYKPWKRKDVPYEEYYFDYAERAGLRTPIFGMRASMTQRALDAEIAGMENLKKLCLTESRKRKIYKEAEYEAEELEKREEELLHDNERREILEKIQRFELEGRFVEDVENDPPYSRLQPGDVDYKHKKWRTRTRNRIVYRQAIKFYNRLLKKGSCVIDGFDGLGILKTVKGGAIITCNHFNPFDSIPLRIAMKKMQPQKKLFTIIREGNYTFPGIYGHFMRNGYTLPLAADYDVMREMIDAVDYWLSKGNYILIYPEQSMWWNYRKPKPVREGAFRFAVKSNVPVIPTFITMRDTDELDSDGYKIQAYTLHIGSPIYPEAGVSMKDNVAKMMKANDDTWKLIYEKEYGIKLEYTTQEKEVTK